VCIYARLNFRDCIRRSLSIKYLTSDEVIEYIREHKLFMEGNGGDIALL
jgi:nicotinamide mononucleotide adenylyltransferase